MRDLRANSEQVIARIAARRHGVVNTAQLRRPASASTHGGVARAREGAAISHQSSAAIWRMLQPHPGPIDVTVSGDAGRRERRGIKVHRSSTFIDGVSILRDGIRITKAVRTLQDLHRTVSEETYRSAVRRALDLRLISSSQLRSDEALTRSELERRFVTLCRRHRLPQPEVNARLGPFEVDFLWRDHRVVVETDSWRHHGDRSAFERDRARDARLKAWGSASCASHIDS